MIQPPGFDTSIPVLTEVVGEPPVLTETVHDTAAPAPAETPEQLERRAIERWSGEEWGVLERRVTERILQQLQGRVDFVLEQRLREDIADAVQAALDDFSAGIRASLQLTIEQVVTQAVAQEIAHLQALGK
ncbi:hypothetical protein [Massilia niastensis]|uniref:hypothetical protein n=1 Tax=Massilia niastensis TaxID=544911 RepID=UPI0003767032|nr:hypothetical protein [Massilia niastensis]